MIIIILCFYMYACNKLIFWCNIWFVREYLSHHWDAEKNVHLLNDISNQFNFNHDDFFNIFYSLNIIFSYMPLNIVFSTLFKINFEKHTQLSNFILFFYYWKNSGRCPQRHGKVLMRAGCAVLTQRWWNLSAYSCVWHRRTSGSHKCKITSSYIWQSNMQNQNHIVVHLTATHDKSKSHSVHLAVKHAKSKSHRRTSDSYTW